MAEDSDLVRAIQLIGQLEERGAGYLLLEDVLKQAPLAESHVFELIARGILLVDHRQRLRVASGEAEDVRVCRLNRHHALVQQADA